LDKDGFILKSQLPSYVDDVIEAYINEEVEEFSAEWLRDGIGSTFVPEKGIIYLVVSEGDYENHQYRWGETRYILCNPSDVNSVNGKTGIVTLTAEDLGAITVTEAKSYADAALEESKTYTETKVNDLREDIEGIINGDSPVTIFVDDALNTESENPVQNKVLTAELNKKVNSEDLSLVAKSGSYNDLDDVPEIFPADTLGGKTADEFELAGAEGRANAYTDEQIESVTNFANTLSGEISIHKTEAEQSFATVTGTLNTLSQDLSNHVENSTSSFAAVRKEIADGDADILGAAKEHSNSNKTAAIDEAKAYTNSKIEKLVTDTDFEGVLSTIQEIQNAMATDEELAQALETANGKKVDKGAVGAQNKPIYFTENGAAEISYTIDKSVPLDAKFTDTTYTLVKDGSNIKLVDNNEKVISTITDNDTNTDTNTTYTLEKDGNNIKLIDNNKDVVSTIVDSDTQVTVDSVLNNASTNPVQNKVIKTELDKKADKTEIPSVSGLATETYVDQKVGAIKVPSIEGLATETYVDQKAGGAETSAKTYAKTYADGKDAAIAEAKTAGTNAQTTATEAKQSASKVASDLATEIKNRTDADTTTLDSAKRYADNKVSGVTASTLGVYTKTEADAKHKDLSDAISTKVDSSTILDDGKIISSLLPSYVDDVIEASIVSGATELSSRWLASNGTTITPEAGKIYIVLSTNKTYRWGGSTYVEISPSLTLGESSSTAYRGDRGKVAYDHSQSAHAPSDAEKNQNAFSKVLVDSTKIEADSATDTLTIVAGSNITLTSDAANNKFTIAAKDTTYGEANTSAAGLMSVDDKKKLDGIDKNANKTTVDSALSSSSTNPVQNKVINSALAEKVNKENGKGLSTNDYTTAEKINLQE
jgi:hypothetical protein